ncbi:hypothetical protein GDO78_023106 [Eleutherodactylus coqui]|uniref:Uncharacterized protein n=1 Tax=Eleutherodactylus coqui TaxID=57060 RepID=A0A8J6B2A0_ELECQ|nr:hypothetical protein GDO78_023106 [Eleutherodactylus coqui]
MVLALAAVPGPFLHVVPRPPSHRTLGLYYVTFSTFWGPLSFLKFLIFLKNFDNKKFVCDFNSAAVRRPSPVCAASCPAAAGEVDLIKICIYLPCDFSCRLVVREP